MTLGRLCRLARIEPRFDLVTQMDGKFVLGESGGSIGISWGDLGFVKLTSSSDIGVKLVVMGVVHNVKLVNGVVQYFRIYC